MIEYATATLLGCEIFTSDNKHRAITWRNAHAETNKISKVENFSTSIKTKAKAALVNASFHLMASPDIHHKPKNGGNSLYERAMYQLIHESVAGYCEDCKVSHDGKKVTMYRLALIIQKLQRAETMVTGKSKAMSDVDNVYDGRVVSWDDKTGEGYMADVDTRHYNFTQLRGKKGRKDNIIRLPSIPPRRAAALDNDMMTLRLSMLAQRDWWMRTPSNLHEKLVR